MQPVPTVRSMHARLSGSMSRTTMSYERSKSIETVRMINMSEDYGVVRCPLATIRGGSLWSEWGVVFVSSKGVQKYSPQYERLRGTFVMPISSSQ